MLWNSIIKLGTLSEIKSEKIDENGDPIETITWGANIYANEKDVRQSEFYLAFREGFKPENMFEIRTTEYAQQKYLQYKNVTYDIIRTFSKNGETTEIIVQGLFA